MPKEVLTETEDDIEVVEVDSPPGEESQAAAAGDTQPAGEGNDVLDTQDDEDGDHEDARLAERDEDPDGAERQKRLNRRQRQKEAKDRTLREVEYLRNRVTELERGQNKLHTDSLAASKASVENRLAEVRKDIATADAIMAQAIKDQDGDAFATAQRLRDEARDQERELDAANKAFATTRTSEADSLIGDAAKRYADEWRRANAGWYDPDPHTTDTASLVAQRIDAQVFREGFDPNKPDYWREVTRRTKEYFDRQKGDGERQDTRQESRQDNGRRKAPPLGNGRGDGNSNGTRVYLSKERVDAMKAAGMWDDPKDRARMIKAYQEYDRDQAAQR